jgi:hypothetical protein
MPNERQLIDTARNIRNAYAHGDWDEVRGLIRPLMLRTAFETVSGLFERLEKKIYPD